MSTMVVVTFSGVPSVGGSVIGGSTAEILLAMKVSLMRDVRSEDLPTLSSPTIAMRTICALDDVNVPRRGRTGSHGPSLR